MEISDDQNSEERQRLILRKNMAIAALCGIFVAGLCYYNSLPYFPICESRSPVSRVQSDMRSLATGIESYFVDNNEYPASASGIQGANGAFLNSAAYRIPTFRNQSDSADKIHTLTTPISYITSYFVDPYADAKRATFAYYRLEIQTTTGTLTPGWLLWSAGPDRDYDIDPIADYTSVQMTYSKPSLLNHTYDPTNGTTSNGDVWRAKQ